MKNRCLYLIGNKTFSRLYNDYDLFVFGDYESLLKCDGDNRENCVTKGPEDAVSYETVYDIVDSINCFIKNTICSDKSHLFLLNKFCEDSAISDINELLVDYYFFERIIFEEGISQIIFCDGSYMEYYSLKALSKKMNIPFSINNRRYRIKYGFKAYSHFSIKYNNIKSIFKIIYLRLLAGAGDTDCKEYDLGFIESKNGTKHESNLLNYLRNIDTVSVCILSCCCQLSKECINIVKEKGIDVVQLESFLSLQSMFLACKTFWSDLRKIMNCYPQSDLLRDDNRWVILMIIDAITKRYWRERVFTFYLYDGYSCKVANKISIKLLTGVGDTNYPINRLLFQYYKEYNVRYFWDVSGVYTSMGDAASQLSIPQDLNMMSTMLVNSNDVFAKQYRRLGWNGTVRVVTPAELREYEAADRGLIRFDNEKKILFAPTYPLPSIYSIDQFIKDNDRVVDDLYMSGCKLYIKYHPNQSEELTARMKKRYSGRRIIWIDQKDSIYNFICDMDIVITTPSTVVVDAAKNHKPVICITNKHDEEWVNRIRDVFCVIDSDMMDLKRMVDDCDMLSGLITSQDKYLGEMIGTDILTIGETVKRLLCETRMSKNE